MLKVLKIKNWSIEIEDGLKLIRQDRAIFLGEVLSEAHLAQLVRITAHRLKVTFGHLLPQNLDLLLNDLIELLSRGFNLAFVELFSTQLALVAAFSANYVVICGNI